MDRSKRLEMMGATVCPTDHHTSHSRRMKQHEALNLTVASDPPPRSEEDGY
jgi:hypothetical protein